MSVSLRKKKKGFIVILKLSKISHFSTIFTVFINSDTFNGSASLLMLNRPICVLLIPCSRFLIEKLTFTRLVKKFTVFYGTRRLITVFTGASHWSLSRARCLQFTPLHPISEKKKTILILSSNLRIGVSRGLFLPGFPTKILYDFSSLPCVLHVKCTCIYRY
jgi:hypothetical protein